MPCSDAMITEVVTIKRDQTISEALELFKEHRIRSMPVVENGNTLAGLLSFSHILYSILPVPTTMGGHLLRVKHMDISLDHLSGGTPWVARRLKSLLETKVEEVMHTDPRTVRPDTPLRECVRLMVKYDSPLPVVESEDSNHLVGLISSQGAICALMDIAEHIKKGNEVDE